MTTFAPHPHLARRIVAILTLLVGCVTALPSAATAADEPGKDMSPPAPRRIDVPAADGPAAAIAMSRMVFDDDEATHAVVASSTTFADALGGSALAGWSGPLLYADADRSLSPATLAELARTLPPDAVVYVLGGTAALPTSVEDQVRAAGLVPVRVGGPERQTTAAMVADTTLEVSSGGHGLPLGGILLAHADNWPDAVTVGQVAAWFAMPVLLTPTNQLGEPARDALTRLRPETVYVLGGTAAVSDSTVAAAIGAADATAVRLGGPSRVETAAMVAAHHRHDLMPRSAEVFTFSGQPVTAPAAAVVVDVYRAWTHTLAAAQLAGNFGAVFVPVTGDGRTVPDVARDTICDLPATVIAAGDTALVSDDAVADAVDATTGTNCTVGSR